MLNMINHKKVMFISLNKCIVFLFDVNIADQENHSWISNRLEPMLWKAEQKLSQVNASSLVKDFFTSASQYQNKDYVTWWEVSASLLMFYYKLKDSLLAEIYTAIWFEGLLNLINEWLHKKQISYKLYLN